MHEHPNDYIKPELMACCGAREIRDGDLVIVGTGFPTVAANIAKYTHAPGATMMQESGVYDARPTRPALSLWEDLKNRRLSVHEDRCIPVVQRLSKTRGAGTHSRPACRAAADLACEVSRAANGPACVVGPAGREKGDSIALVEGEALEVECREERVELNTEGNSSRSSAGKRGVGLAERSLRVNGAPGLESKPETPPRPPKRARNELQVLPRRGSRKAGKTKAAKTTTSMQFIILMHRRRLVYHP